MNQSEAQRHMASDNLHCILPIRATKSKSTGKENTDSWVSDKIPSRRSNFLTGACWCKISPQIPTSSLQPILLLPFLYMLRARWCHFRGQVGYRSGHLTGSLKRTGQSGWRALGYRVPRYWQWSTVFAWDWRRGPSCLMRRQPNAVVHVLRAGGSWGLAKTVGTRDQNKERTRETGENRRHVVS